MLSIKLQENNVKPDEKLRPAAQAVVQTSEVLAQIARDKGKAEYADYPDIQSDIFDCADQVSAALEKFPPALSNLYESENRADGWHRIVQAVQSIASNTSRLLLVVYGAEHRRLLKAGMILLDTCAEAKPHALLPTAELIAEAKKLVESTNQLSTDLMVFNAYVQARAKETEGEGPKAELLARSVGDFNRLNTAVVNACNDLLSKADGPDAESKRQYVNHVSEIERITREILDILAPPEDMDIFQLVQGLGSSKAARIEEAPKSLQAWLDQEKRLKEAAKKLKLANNPLLEAATMTPAAAEKQANETVAAAAQFQALGRARAAAHPDEATREALQLDLDKLDRAVGLLHANAKKMKQDPKAAESTAKAAKAVDGLVDRFMRTAAPAVQVCEAGSGEGLSTTDASIGAAADAARAAIAKLADGFEHMTGDELAAMAKEASEKLAKFIEHCKAKIADPNTDEATRAKLKEMLPVLEEDNRVLVSATNAYLDDRNPQTKTALKNACEKALSDIDRTMADMNSRKSRKTAHGFEDQIDDAAMDIVEAVDEYSHLPPEVASLARELADLMQQMADAARTGDRQRIIECARGISDIIKKLQKYAKPFAADVKDPRMKDNLLTSVNALGNFGVQLRILASVKAASVGNDPAAENQLVSCCEGISASMRGTLEGVQSAKLKK